MHTLFCVIGETASGKDTIVNGISNWMQSPKNLKKVVSYTTRPKRPTETDGKEHHFVTDEEYDNIHSSSQVVAETCIGGIRYMSTGEECLKSDIYIIDPNGFEVLKENLDQREVRLVSIYVYAPIEDRIRRSTERNGGAYDYALNKRIESEYDQFNNFYISKKWDYCLYNLDGMCEFNIKTLENIINFELNKRI